MLINNSTRILNDSWDRDKWKTIATSVRKKSVVINVLILAGLKRDSGAGSWNSLEGVGERGNTGSSPQLASVYNNRGRRNHFPLSPILIWPALGAGTRVGVFVQVMFGAMLWQFLVLFLWESQLLAAISASVHKCSYFPKPWQSASSSILLCFEYDSLRH